MNTMVPIAPLSSVSSTPPIPQEWPSVGALTLHRNYFVDQKTRQIMLKL